MYLYIFSFSVKMWCSSSLRYMYILYTKQVQEIVPKIQNSCSVLAVLWVQVSELISGDKKWDGCITHICSAKEVIMDISCKVTGTLPANWNILCLLQSRLVARGGRSMWCEGKNWRARGHPVVAGSDSLSLERQTPQCNLWITCCSLVNFHEVGGYSQ